MSSGSGAVLSTQVKGGNHVGSFCCNAFNPQLGFVDNCR